MKRAYAFLVLPVASLLLAVTPMSSSQDPSLRGVPMDEALQAWIEAGTPGPMHERLTRQVGRWKTSMRTWCEPGAEPMVSEGEAVIEPILGGRFVEERATSTMMGQPTERRHYTGYSNIRKQFVSFSIDSMSTGVIASCGGLSPDGNVLTLFSRMDEPMTGEIAKPVQSVIRFEGEGRFVVEAFEVIHGEPYRVVEIQYDRQE